jgi:hypothetical protein
MLLDLWRILVEQSIQDIGSFAHRTVDHIDPVLFAAVVDVVVQGQAPTSAKIAGIVPPTQIRSGHPKAYSIGGRGLPIAEQGGKRERSI